MKTTLNSFFVLCFCVITIQLSSQYKPMTANSKEWLVKTCTLGNCLHDYYYFSTDTLIGNKWYKVLDGYHYNKNFFLREDIQKRQVFILINDGRPILEEYLMYDFGMNIGDSTYVVNPISPAINIEGYYTLDSVITKNFEQINRRVFYLHGYDLQNNYHETKWIEGVGSTGLINTPGVMGDTTTAVLLCVSENANKIYSRKANDTCYSNPILSLPNSRNNEGFDFYYATYSQQLKFENLLQHATLKIFDLNGRLVRSQTLNREAKALLLNDFEAGVYIISIQTSDYRLVKKIMVNTN